MSVRILLADDDAALRRVLQFKLEEHGFQVTSVPDGERALEALGRKPYVLLLSDMRMPGLSGIELLEKARALQPQLEVILMTAYAEVSQAVKAVKLGAFDYLTKPFDDDQLLVAIDKAVRFRQLEDENRSLKEQLSGRKSVPVVVGVSKSFKDLQALVDKIASADATVLISGPSGSGKEVIARMIHRKSPRSDGPFVAVNCAAIPRDLIESELFGHVKGAFTGAIKDKKGKFELADGGTLLLDEVSELNIELQAKLLRAVQERIIEPVGAEKRIEIDVRLLAATNVNLKERVKSGRFREDLFYRLNVIPVMVPSLRERPEDIPLLVQTFVSRFSPEARIEVDDDLIDMLATCEWPGNIRELENLIERMLVLRHSDRLGVGDLPPEYRAEPSQDDDTNAGVPERDLSFAEAEKRLILRALEKAGWNKTRAAEMLKVPRHILVYRMKKYSLVPPR
ncbi:MAG TPA: sigma-54 dependent transcriptional regulator [Acidobacteriota bacterium]|nr:sigma-54 dependent transcriptional regulator [Acidobacteriota bacterium]